MALIKDVQKNYKKIKNNTDVFLDVPINELKKEIQRNFIKNILQVKLKIWPV